MKTGSSFEKSISHEWLNMMKEGSYSKLKTGKALLDRRLREQLVSGFNDSKACCVFLVDLHAQPNWYRQRILKDYLQEHPNLVEDCVVEYLEPSLSEFFTKVIAEGQKEINKEGVQHDSWDEAIREFIDQGQFNKVLKSFRQREHLRRINRDFCSKVFYHAFQEHFDACSGMGMVEMIKVGEKHPKTLKKMSLMQEYDDIRAALLKLQLTGKIDSLNYK